LAAILPQKDKAFVSFLALAAHGKRRVNRNERKLIANNTVK
jgi:hypothetical protein